MRRTLALGLLVVALAALFVRLGFWQLHRLAERKAANAEIRHALAQPAFALEGRLLSDPRALDALAYRHATAAGRYDRDRETVVKRRIWEGTPGVELLAPLELEGGGEMWVNRGWVPSPDAETVDPAPYRERGLVHVRGYLRPPTPQERDTAARPALVLEQLPDPSLPRYPVRRGEPVLDNGPHLSYAIQWFSFAAIALGGYGALLASRRRGQSGKAEGTMERASAPSAGRVRGESS